MPLTIRSLRDDEGRLYLEIVNRAIRGLAIAHYPPDIIDRWVVPLTDESVQNLMLNPDHELRLIAELNGTPAGIGALVVQRSELRACYVTPEAARQGCGSALVTEIERVARAHALTRLVLAASINGDPFYAAHGYVVRERSTVALSNGLRMHAVWMEKNL